MKTIGNEANMVKDVQQKLSIVVDLSNILYQGNGSKAKMANFRLVRQALDKEYPSASIFYLADANTRHKIDERAAYDDLCNDGTIIQTPAGEQADHYLLAYAARILNCVVISCDRFKDHHIADDLSRRIVPVVIIGDQVIFSRKLTEFVAPAHGSPIITRTINM